MQHLDALAPQPLIRHVATKVEAHVLGAAELLATAQAELIDMHASSRIHEEAVVACLRACQKTRRLLEIIRSNASSRLRCPQDQAQELEDFWRS